MFGRFLNTPLVYSAMIKIKPFEEPLAGRVLLLTDPQSAWTMAPVSIYIEIRKQNSIVKKKQNSL